MPKGSVLDYRVIATAKNELKTKHIGELPEGSESLPIGGQICFDDHPNGWKLGRILHIGGIDLIREHHKGLETESPYIFDISQL
jgi:hypothetical protein